MYFRRARPYLDGLGVHEELRQMDELMQALLKLSQSRNRKQSYNRVLAASRALQNPIEINREMQIGRREGSFALQPTVLGGTEALILRTLKQLVPSAALSYEQAIRDIADGDRISYRGTANELREALREVLDRMAPDAEVMASSGWTAEGEQSRPTQRQKVRFILSSRRASSAVVSAPERSVELIDEMIARLTRSVSERSSLSTHVASSRQQVAQLKLYIDSVLAELLQVHG